MTSKPKDLKRSLRAHRQVERRYRHRAVFQAALVMLVAALLTMSLLWDWAVALVMVFAIGVVTTLIGLLADINALSDRRKIIAETMAQIEDADRRAQPDPQQPGALQAGPPRTQ